jgi:hypothetical protein
MHQQAPGRPVRGKRKIQRSGKVACEQISSAGFSLSGFDFCRISKKSTQAEESAPPCGSAKRLMILVEDFPQQRNLNLWATYFSHEN